MVVLLVVTVLFLVDLRMRSEVISSRNVYDGEWRSISWEWRKLVGESPHLFYKASMCLNNHCISRCGFWMVTVNTSEYQGICVCTHTHTYLSMHTHTHRCTYTQTCTSVHVPIYIYIYIYMSVYVYWLSM